MRHTRKINHGISDLRLETLIVGLLISGFSLLYTDTPIQVLIHKFIKAIGSNYNLIKHTIVSSLQSIIYNMEFSDLVGTILIVISLSLMLNRVRNRIIAHSPDSNLCPSCNHKLYRIHRSRGQRMVSKLLYLSSGNYHCIECGESSLHFYKRSIPLSQG